LDSGYDESSKFIHNYLIKLLPEIIEKKLFIDPKSHLQEKVQEKLGVTPNYKVINEEGPDHDRVFTVAVMAGAKEIAQGKGSSKQRAEQEAATNALSSWPED
jgi:ribonuclease-3